MIDVRGWLQTGARLAALTLIGAACAACAGPPATSGAGGGGTGGATGGASSSGGTGGVACEPGQEICDGEDNDCDGETDNVPGGCACTDGETQGCYSGPAGTEGVGECKTGTQTCAGGAWGECTGQVLPGSEACNLKDDDCNGVADDMGVVTCGIGECQSSVDACIDGQAQSCVPGQPSVEVCDGKDNNCNQLVDENDPVAGTACTTGSPGVCASGKNECIDATIQCVPNVLASVETCDGKDNDCDGVADNNIPGTGGLCSTGAQGVCDAGALSCKAVGGVFQIDCFSIVNPTIEVCDGLDNNCNGSNDEGDPGGGAACNTGVAGICGPGVLHCVNGAVQCVANQAATPETCNGLDDNCDGQIDEGDPGGGLGCNTGVPGVCLTGMTQCHNGAILCLQTVMPGVETCNGLDDDCNGVADNGNPGGGAACSTGLLGVCAAGTITCQSAQLTCLQNVQSSPEVCGNAEDENCDGVAVASPTVYFSETFANNAAGWTLDTNWSIGPTVMSAANSSCGIGDPAQDHTPTADNGVAGNVLGGNISTALGGPYYLTSPPVDTSAAPSLYLEYWRWLHSDYPNFMVDKVEVWNGAAWVSVWQNPAGQVVNDTAWTKMSHDVTAHKNANFRVRYSYLIGSSGVFVCAGWNIDDVQLVDAPCN